MRVASQVGLTQANGKFSVCLLSILRSRHSTSLTPAVIQKYLDHYEFEPYHLSLGREGMEEDGQPVYMVSYFLNKELKQSIAVITSPSGHESCMMYKSFDLIYPGEDT